MVLALLQHGQGQQQAGVGGGVGLGAHHGQALGQVSPRPLKPARIAVNNGQVVEAVHDVGHHVHLLPAAQALLVGDLGGRQVLLLQVNLADGPIRVGHGSSVVGRLAQAQAPQTQAHGLREAALAGAALGGVGIVVAGPQRVAQRYKLAGRNQVQPHRLVGVAALSRQRGQVVARPGHPQPVANGLGQPHGPPPVAPGLGRVVVLKIEHERHQRLCAVGVAGVLGHYAAQAVHGAHVAGRRQDYCLLAPGRAGKGQRD